MVGNAVELNLRTGWTDGKSCHAGKGTVKQAKRVSSPGRMESETWATSGQAGSCTMIKQKMSTAKHHSTKATAQMYWFAVICTADAEGSPSRGDW